MKKEDHIVSNKKEDLIGSKLLQFPSEQGPQRVQLTYCLTLIFMYNYNPGCNVSSAIITNIDLPTCTSEYHIKAETQAKFYAFMICLPSDV